MKYMTSNNIEITGTKTRVSDNTINSSLSDLIYTNREPFELWWRMLKHLNELKLFMRDETMSRQKRIRLHHYKARLELYIRRFDQIELVPCYINNDYRDGNGY